MALTNGFPVAFNSSSISERQRKRSSLRQKNCESLGSSRVFNCLPEYGSWTIRTTASGKAGVPSPCTKNIESQGYESSTLSAGLALRSTRIAFPLRPITSRYLTCFDSPFPTTARQGIRKSRPNQSLKVNLTCEYVSLWNSGIGSWSAPSRDSATSG